MNYHDALAKIAAKLNFTQTSVRAVLAELPAVVVEGLETDGHFMLPGLGNFKKTITKARAAMNLQTKTKIQIPPRARVTFKVAKAVKGGLTIKAPAAPAAAVKAK